MMRQENGVCPGIAAGFALLLLNTVGAAAAALPVVPDLEWQPLAAQARRVIEALDYLGAPFSADELKAIEAAMAKSDAQQLQQAFDGHCLLGVTINPEMRVKVQQGPAKPELVEKGWRSFLVKVQNEAGTTAAMQLLSPNA